jgi:hypothetical protein
VTKDQLQKECDRLQALLEMYEARAAAGSVAEHHNGLRQRLAGMLQKLAERAPE